MTKNDRLYFFRTLRYVKPYIFIYSIGTFLYCVQQFIFPFISGIFMGSTMSAILESSFDGVLNALLYMGIMIFIAMMIIGVGTYLYIVSTCYTTRDLSVDLFRAFMKSSIESQKHSGEGIASLNTDIDTASDIYSNALSPFLQSVIGASFSAVAVLAIDWRMGIGAIAVGLLSFFVQSRFAEPLARLGKARLEINADSVKSLSTIFSGALAIRAFNRQDRSLFQYDRENGKLKKLAFKQAFLGMWQDLFTTVQGWLTLILVFALGSFLVINGQMDFAQIMMVLPLAGAISMAMSQIGAAYAGLQPPVVAAKRIFDVLDSAGETGNEKSASKLDKSQATPGHTEWNGKYDIKLNKLSFLYKDATGEALKDIELYIKENRMVAFVGESGSGKSTLLRVIIGMYERNGLDMEIGDLHFNSESIDEWRSHFAYVDQSCKLFDMSIAENISMGKRGKASDEEIQDAAKRAFAFDFISELPEGYDTACGEKGASLSGGQKQRLAIARALCRKAPVLVFDEATSALDAESERYIMETIENLRTDHTILITTHNLGNITTADKIVVMDKGQIAEHGTHAELLEKDGLYVKLLNQ
jgi:subfamily B ATP-binding cassette protein MsbA